MGISVLVLSTLANDKTKPATISINKRLGQPATAEVSTVDRTGTFFPYVGNKIEILDQNGDPIFFGNANEVERIRPGHYACDVSESRTSCTDLNFALTRRLAGEYEWIGKTLLEIVTDIVANSLSGDLTDISLVETGPVIPNLSISYPTVQDAFNRLKKETGLEWFVDDENKLHFFTPGTVNCPWSIVDGSNLERIVIRETREDYCNWAVARVLKALREPATEEFIGDSTTTSFELDFPCAQEPTIFLNGVANTVGLTTVDTGKDWYWSPESKEIRQDEAGLVLTSADTLSVTYVGQEQIYVESKNDAEISSRAAAEDNSGIYQRLIEIEAESTRADAQAIVDAYVDAHSSLSLVATIETNDHAEPLVLGTRVGQTISIGINGYGTLGDFLITDINIMHWDVNDQAKSQWKYTITAVQGPKLKNFVEAFGDLIGSGQSGVSKQPVATPERRPIQRTLLLKDTTVGNDIADHTTVYAGGTGRRLTGVLRNAISSDLTVRVNKYTVSSPVAAATAICTLTIPSGTPINTPVTQTTFTDDPQQFSDGDVLIWDVVASDGQTDAAGVAAFTLEWTSVTGL
jgi:hypothetical protein